MMHIFIWINQHFILIPTWSGKSYYEEQLFSLSSQFSWPLKQSSSWFRTSMSNECGPKFLTQANIYRFFSPVTFCIKNPWSRDILVLRIHSCKSNEPWNWPPTSCFRIHCWYIYIAIKESCYIQQNAYQTTTKLSLVICEYGLRELRAVWPSSSMYLLLSYDRRSGDDMTHLLMYENLMIVRSWQYFLKVRT